MPPSEGGCRGQILWRRESGSCSCGLPHDHQHRDLRVALGGGREGEEGREEEGREEEGREEREREEGGGKGGR